MKLKIIFLFLPLIFNGIAQTGEDNKTETLVLLDIKYKGTICLYNKEGKLIKKLKHNFKEEDYLVFNIVGKNDSMYNVRANYAIAGFIATGWIKRSNSKLGVYSKAYSSILNLYQYPKNNGPIQQAIKEYNPELFEVKDWQDGWQYIYTKIDN